MSLKKISMLAPKGSACRPGYALKPEYITIHNTGNTSKGSDADNHAKYLRGAGKDLTVSYHYAVDDHQAVLIIPEKENAWHAGDGRNGTGNRKSLAIEICENSDGDLKKATDNAVLLVQELMKKYGIPISNVVTHSHWIRKQCPRRLLAGEPYTWEAFLKKVQGNEKAEPEKAKPSKTYTVQAAVGTAIYSPVGKIEKKGVYTIVEEKDGMGKLKSGAGWVNLADVQKQ